MQLLWVRVECFFFGVEGGREGGGDTPWAGWVGMNPPQHIYPVVVTRHMDTLRIEQRTLCDTLTSSPSLTKCKAVVGKGSTFFTARGNNPWPLVPTTGRGLPLLYQQPPWGNCPPP